MKYKKRELDSVTPNLTLSPEDIADIKRAMVDKEFAEEQLENYRALEKKQLETLKHIALTGQDLNGKVMPLRLVKECADEYESITGEKLNVYPKAKNIIL